MKTDTIRRRVEDYRLGMRSLLHRNVVLLILINMLNQYGNLLKNSFRGLFAAQTVGVGPAVIGSAVSVFLVVSALCRVPAGMIMDTCRRAVRYILAGVFLMKAITVFGFLSVRDAAALYALFAVDSVSSAFLTVAMPVLLALIIDTRAIGSAYALMIGIGSILTGHARSLGVTLYTEYGLLSAVTVTALVSLAACGACLLLDPAPILRKTVPDTNARSRRHKGILPQMLPLAAVAAMPIIMYQAETNFLALHAESFGFVYLTVLALAGTIDGINSLIVGFLCDIIDPSVFIVLGLLGCITGTILFSAAGDSRTFCAGILIYYFTQNYDMAFRIMGMKMVSSAEQGAFQGTLLLFNEALSALCAPLLGIIAETRGFPAMWKFVSVWVSAALIGFLLLRKTIFKRLSGAVSMHDSSEKH